MSNRGDAGRLPKVPSGDANVSCYCLGGTVVDWCTQVLGELSVNRGCAQARVPIRQLVYALRNGPSRLARSLARASNGDIHACTLPLMSAVRHRDWEVCMGLLRDRDKVGA